MAITDKGMKGQATAGDQWLSESLGRGFGVLQGRITPGGERRFYYRYTDETGKRPFLLIGGYSPNANSGLTLAQARSKALELAALHRTHPNLREYLDQRQAAQQQAEADTRQAAELERQHVAAEVESKRLEDERRITINRLFERWQATALKPQTLADGTRTGRKDGGAWVQAAFERRLFPKLGNVAAADVTKADLLAILDECKAGGQRRTANVLLADMKQMFTFAADRDIVTRNPLDSIKRAAVGGKDVERARTLTEDEIKALWAAVPTAGMNPRSAASVWLILGTACRMGEAMSARWEHVDLKRRTWYLPETKNERDHLIHLSDFALVQFTALAELREPGPDGKPSPWLFPNATGKEGVCVKSVGKQLADRQRAPDKRLKNRSKSTLALVLAGGRWTAHDLRRTAATMMARLGIGTDVVDECLNHKLQSRVARMYITDRRLPQQAHAFDALGARLQALIEGTLTTNVVAMKARSR